MAGDFFARLEEQPTQVLRTLLARTPRVGPDDHLRKGYRTRLLRELGRREGFDGMAFDKWSNPLLLEHEVDPREAIEPYRSLAEACRED